MNLVAYDVPSLLWGPLGSEEKERGETEQLFGVIQQHILSENPWLLEEGQILPVPPCHLDADPSRNASSGVFSMGDFCIRAVEACETDVQRCAYNENGSRKELTANQFLEVSRTGQMSVPSLLFQNQNHVWRVARSFYAGHETNQEAWKQGVGQALDHWVIRTREAVLAADDSSTSWWRRLSFFNAIRQGFVQAIKVLGNALVQGLVGPPKPRKYSKETISRLVREAEQGFVASELRKIEADVRACRDPLSPVTPEDVCAMWDILKEDADWGSDCRRSEQDIRDEQRMSREIEQAESTFARIMNKKRNIDLEIDIDLSMDSPLAAKKEAKRAAEAWGKRIKSDWVEYLRDSPPQLDPSVASLEADRAMASELELEVKANDEVCIQEGKTKYEKDIRSKHPFLYKSGLWRNRKLTRWEQQERNTLVFTRLDRVAKKLEALDLPVESAIRRSRMKFRKEIRSIIENRLAGHRATYPPAQFDIVQLNPNRGRHKTVKVDIGKPLWRMRYTWMAMVQLTKCLIGSSYFFLASGPLSLRALISRHPYYAVEEPQRDSGSYTPTLSSRLRSFYSSLRAARQRFESAPDTGLIGKGIQRTFLLSYLASKCIIGTVSIGSFMILGTIISTATSSAALVLAPLLAAFGATMMTLFHLTVYDFALAAACSRISAASFRRNLLIEHGDLPSAVSPIGKIVIGVPYLALVPGLMQAMLATLRLVVLHPLAGAAHIVVSSVVWTLRSLRDSFTWPLIRWQARIPASDTFLASRIGGPGMAATFYFRLPLDAAKEALRLALDGLRLECHSQLRRNELDSAFNEYQSFFRDLMEPFGVSTSTRMARPSQLAHE